jgi:ribonuclease R
MTRKHSKRQKKRSKRKLKDTQNVPSREAILEYIIQYKKPVSKTRLVKAFKLTFHNDKQVLNYRLKAMLRDQQLIKNRAGNYATPSELSLVKGCVQATKDGFGFLIPNDGSPDIFLPTSEMRNLLNNDIVLVAVTRINKRRSQREGRLVEIISHDPKPLIGRFYQEKNICFIEPCDRTFFQNVLILENLLSAKSGQYVLFKLTPTPTKYHQPTGHIIKILGDTITPGLEINIAIHTNHIPHEFGKTQLTAANQCLTIDIDKLTSAYQNHTALNFVTIDGEDAKDFDDAVFCEKTKNGWALYVAIADVSTYIEPNSPLDAEAFNRGTSVYFPNAVIPMLPEVLSNNLCSLIPNAKRPTLICQIQISHEGIIQSYQFYNALICSKARLTYKEVNQTLATNQKHPYITELQNLHDVYQKLHHQRKLRGAIDFDTIETKIIFNKKGKIESIVPIERGISNRIIEEAMLASNICAANFLHKNKIPFLYRNHEPPEMEKIKSLRDFLIFFDLKLTGSLNPKSMDYVNLLKRIKSRPEKYLLQTVLLRSLSQAYYSPQNTGHFGLAYDNYTHFTSPIRRYPDLVAHRAIKHVIANTKTPFVYDMEKLQSMGQHCSITERRAEEASRNAVTWLKCHYMQDRIGEKFSGIISGVTGFGLFIELDQVYVEGLAHISSLKNDYYDYDDTHHLLRGRRSGLTYRLGDKVQVLVARVNLDDQEIDLEII